jgi:hypothetical protein
MAQESISHAGYAAPAKARRASAWDWRARLRGDPAPWLLDADRDPSVCFWFLRDIVGRPMDAPVLLALRERILFSAPVQAIFAAQNADGFWENPAALDAPRYTATLWSLALLAELGLDSHSRRARAACEFVLQNHLRANGSFGGLGDDTRAGLLVRALACFWPSDARLVRAHRALAERAACGEIFALWAMAEMPLEWRAAEFTRAVQAGADRVCAQLARGEFDVWGAFPPFEPRDAVLALRVLTRLGFADDARIAASIDRLWDEQSEGARWEGEDSSGVLYARLNAETLSKWATLGALRIVTRL